MFTALCCSTPSTSTMSRGPSGVPTACASACSTMRRSALSTAVSLASVRAAMVVARISSSRLGSSI